MAELTEEQIAEYDTINSSLENAECDYSKFQALYETEKQKLDALIAAGYKTPDERKEMAVNDSTFYSVQSLELNLTNFENKKLVYAAQIETAKAAGYKTKAERTAEEAAANAERKAAKKALKLEEVVSE